MQNICDYKIETKENTDCLSEVINDSTNVEIDCNVYCTSNKSELNNTHNKPEMLLLPTENKSIEDCKNIFPTLSKEPKYTSLKRKGEKYFPHFKTKVVSYALKHSIKKAASDFKVNKGTISGWIHESQLQTFKETPSSTLCCECLGPDEQFIRWLKGFEGSNALSKQRVVNKVCDIVRSFDKQEPRKTSSWFFLYAKRLTNESCLDKIKIKYPLAFKKEVASFTKYMSKKMTSKVFNIDRKRICEWVSDFNSGNIKARDVSKYVTDPKVDKMIWDWYCLQHNKPSGKEIRLKASILYQEAGFSDMMCSPGWYYRWRLRYKLPTVRGSQACRNSKLLAWALIQIDENKSVFHSDLLKQAALFKEATFKASSSWVFRFIKKYMSHFEPGISNIPLPKNLIEEVNKFKKLVFTNIRKNNIQLQNIVAFDEVPLNFSSSDSGKQNGLVGKSGWENCQASIIVSCIASGSLLPTALILKSQTETDVVQGPDVQPILFQTNGINDFSTMEKWLEVLLRCLTIPAVVIGDIYEPHIHIKNTYFNDVDKQNIDLMIIPGGCTSQLQPLFFGIIQRFKAEIETQWVRWCNEVSDNSKLIHPKGNHIVNWVENAHLVIASSCKDLIKESFIKAGIINHHT